MGASTNLNLNTSHFKDDSVLLTVLSEILTREREREGGGRGGETERDRQTDRSVLFHDANNC